MIITAERRTDMHEIDNAIKHLIGRPCYRIYTTGIGRGRRGEIIDTWNRAVTSRIDLDRYAIMHLNGNCRLSIQCVNFTKGMMPMVDNTVFFVREEAEQVLQYALQQAGQKMDKASKKGIILK